MHNKVLLVDDTVIIGSYNFSRSAQFNAENILFIESAAAADATASILTTYWKSTAAAVSE